MRAIRPWLFGNVGRGGSAGTVTVGIDTVTAGTVTFGTVIAGTVIAGTDTLTYGSRGAAVGGVAGVAGAEVFADLAGAWVAVAAGLAAGVGVAGVAFGVGVGVGVGVGTAAVAVGFETAGVGVPVFEAVVVACAWPLVFGLVSCLTSAGRACSALGAVVRRTRGVTACRTDRRAVSPAVERAFREAALVTSAVEPLWWALVVRCVEADRCAAGAWTEAGEPVSGTPSADPSAPGLRSRPGSRISTASAVATSAPAIR